MGWRKTYFLSSFIASWGPIVIWPLALIGYLLHSLLNISDYSSISYIVVKLLLFVIYDLIAVFFVFENMWPTYKWW